MLIALWPICLPLYTLFNHRSRQALRLKCTLQHNNSCLLINFQLEFFLSFFISVVDFIYLFSTFYFCSVVYRSLCKCGRHFVVFLRLIYFNSIIIHKYNNKHHNTKVQTHTHTHMHSIQRRSQKHKERKIQNNTFFVYHILSLPPEMVIMVEKYFIVRYQDFVRCF